jgi:hypothetical protein
MPDVREFSGGREWFYKEYFQLFRKCTGVGRFILDYYLFGFYTISFNREFDVPCYLFFLNYADKNIGISGQPPAGNCKLTIICYSTDSYGNGYF